MNRPEYNFIEVLELIEKTPKTNDKIKILQDNFWDTNLKDFLVLAVCETKKFNIVEWAENKGTGKAYSRIGLGIWENFQLLVNGLMTGDATGHAANDAIISFLGLCTELEKKWYGRCLKKDIASTKIGRKIMDEVWPGSVLYFKCGLAEKEDQIDIILKEDQNSFQTEYAYLEIKKNGIRTFFESTKTGLLTPVGRSGLPIDNFSILSGSLAKLNALNIMFDGECSVNDNLEDTMTVFGFDFTKTEKDFIGKNGKVSKAWEKYQEKFARADALRQQLKFTIFAAIPLDEWYTRNAKWTYEEMRAYLEQTIHPLISKLNLFNKIEVIDTIQVGTYFEAREIANIWMANGLEGGILKSPKHTYPFNRSRDWIKLKEEVETDFKITGYVLQKDKYNGDGTLKPPMIGKFTGYDQADRHYGVGTGKGWNEDFYIHALANFETEFMNKIMKITAQRFTDKAAICPRFDMWRLDKLTLED